MSSMDMMMPPEPPTEPPEVAEPRTCGSCAMFEHAPGGEWGICHMLTDWAGHEVTWTRRESYEGTEGCWTDEEGR